MPAPTRSNAVPVPAGDAPVMPPLPIGVPEVRVVVVDTGLAAVTFRPDFAGGDVQARQNSGLDAPDPGHDGYLDPVAGHGTFIAGILRRLAPGSRVAVDQVLDTFGVGEDFEIALHLDAIASSGPLPHLVNLSFSGYTIDDQPPAAIAGAVASLQDAGVVVVASAGNSASCRLNWPAALSDVIAVGALGSQGAAPFSNFGPWVDACAPGVDIISTFFENCLSGGGAVPSDSDLDDFKGWARWSGTSFSAPIVVAALARHMMSHGASAKDAVKAVLHDPGLFRFPGLGTVVNEA